MHPSVYGRGDQLTHVFAARAIGGRPKRIGLEITGLRWVLSRRLAARLAAIASPNDRRCVGGRRACRAAHRVSGSAIVSRAGCVFGAAGGERWYSTGFEKGQAMILRGRVWKYGDDVNTDVIFPWQIHLHGDGP